MAQRNYELASSRPRRRRRRPRARARERSQGHHRSSAGGHAAATARSTQCAHRAGERGDRGHQRNRLHRSRHRRHPSAPADPADARHRTDRRAAPSRRLARHDHRPDGSVEHVKLNTPLNRHHERMIVSPAKAWQFRPATKGGRARAVSDHASRSICRSRGRSFRRSFLVRRSWFGVRRFVVRGSSFVVRRSGFVYGSWFRRCCPQPERRRSLAEAHRGAEPRTNDEPRTTCGIVDAFASQL